MPLSDFQIELAKTLAVNRSADSYLAGGAALHLLPSGQRYSNDLDYFNDSLERVAQAFTEDRDLLVRAGFQLDIKLRLKHDSFVRALVRKDGQASKIEWAQDSAWRFLPTQKSKICGFILHPLDLATNKVLALAGRNEVRDWLDTLYIHQHILPLGALCWAAAGKDPGFTPHSLLELLRRRGKVRSEDIRRLHLVRPVDHRQLKEQWLEALDQAQQFINARPDDEMGCLYYCRKTKKFIQPESADENKDVICHFGKAGGREIDSEQEAVGQA